MPYLFYRDVVLFFVVRKPQYCKGFISNNASLYPKSDITQGGTNLRIETIQIEQIKANA